MEGAADGRAAGATRQSRGADELVFMALGGIGEIGMNCYLYGLGPADARQWLMVDLGITFPEGENDPGIDVILPDLRFIEEERGSLAGLVLTHAHEDHIGAVIELWPRLQGADLCNAVHGGDARRPSSPSIGGKAAAADQGGGRSTAASTSGPFDLELISVAHSIPESNALAIRTPHGLVLHTGDWKIDATPVIGAPTDEARLRQLGEEGVTAMICDSTNALREGRSPSERDVARSLAGIIKGAKRRVAVTIFASNVARIRAVADAARSAGRHLVVAGRAMHRIIERGDRDGLSADQLQVPRPGALLVPASRTRWCCCAPAARASRARRWRASPTTSTPPSSSARATSSSSPRAPSPATSARSAASRTGWSISAATSITDGDALVHVTGHPRREELKEMYGWVQPRIAIPMHGEARHLSEHAKLARAAGVGEVLSVRNGDMVRLAPGTAEIIDEAPVGRLFRDGSLLVPSRGRAGARAPLAGLRRHRRRGAGALGRAARCWPSPRSRSTACRRRTRKGRPMRDIVRDAVEGTIASIPRDRRQDGEMVREAVRRAVRSAVEDAWGKRPIAKVLLVQAPR